MDLVYTSELPTKEDLYELYDHLGWNGFTKLSPERLLEAMKQSWYSIYVYSGKKLIGTGRVVSDGISNAYMCGLGVNTDYRNRGIGTEIVRRLVQRCSKSNLHIQFLCEEHLVRYYEKMGFEKFGAGMWAKD